MPVIGSPIGTYFTLRMYKRLTTNPALAWANTYEFVSLTVTTEGDVNTLIARTLLFEQALHLPSAQFDRAVLSSWVEDGEPYDPTTFITQPLSAVGTRAVAGDPLSLNYCLFLRRVTAFGQNGKLFLRRALTEGDITSPSGTPALNSAAALQAEVADAVADSEMIEYLTGADAFQVVMKSSLLINREVTSFVVAGSRIIQYNNRYFDVP